MNRRNYLYSAVMLFTALLFSNAAFGDLVTFEVRGHVTDSPTSDFTPGDTFIADFTFDPTVAPTYNISPDVDAQYVSATAWRIDFARGYSFVADPTNQAVEFDLANNNTYDITYNGTDLYVVTFGATKSIGAPLPSGLRVNFFQFDIRDFTPSGNPDLLSNISLPTIPPALSKSDQATGSLDYDNFQFSNDVDFALDSITVVPEPSTAVLAIFWFGVLAIIWLLRQCLRWGQRLPHRRSFCSGANSSVYPGCFVLGNGGAVLLDRRLSAAARFQAADGPQRAECAEYGGIDQDLQIRKYRQRQTPLMPENKMIGIRREIQSDQIFGKLPIAK